MTTTSGCAAEVLSIASAPSAASMTSKPQIDRCSRVQDTQGGIILGDEKKRPSTVAAAGELCGGIHPVRLSHAPFGRLI